MDNDPVDDRRFTQASTLRDGTPVTIRAARADDRERLVAAFRKLEPRTVYTRFFSLVKEIPAQALGLIDAVDFDRIGALVVTLGTGDDEVVIGGASYVVCASDAEGKTAEVAFTIEEDYQGQGLASKLLALLTALARRHGITRFVADVLAANGAMLAVFQRCGLPMHQRRDADVVHVSFDLRLPPG
ncbi:MAG: GNAT family N-acetyltransferase [Burkholderiaceae bacterium]|nr:GNAT family N-acetyltransferase [Burkholderiaceae bacterium]